MDANVFFQIQDFMWPYTEWLLSRALLLGLVLSVFRKTRDVGAFSFDLSAWSVAILLWVMSAAYTVSFWGWTGFILATLVFGIGVIPAAFLIAFIYDVSGLALWIFVGGIVTTVLHFVAAFVKSKTKPPADNKAQESNSETPRTPVSYLPYHNEAIP